MALSREKLDRLEVERAGIKVERVERVVRSERYEAEAMRRFGLGVDFAEGDWFQVEDGEGDEEAIRTDVP